MRARWCVSLCVVSQSAPIQLMCGLEDCPFFPRCFATGSPYHEVQKKKKTELENLFRSFPTAGTRTDTHTDTHGVKEGVICLTLGYTSPMCARVVVSAGVTVSRATLLEKRHLVVHAKY